MFSSLKVICAWCLKYLRGNYDSSQISHGICGNCHDELLGREMEKNPWVLWQDFGGSD